MATRKIKVLRVVSRTDRFRRAGFEFGAKSQDIALDTLSKDQLTALKGEPNLVTVEVEVLIDEHGNVVDAPTTDTGDSEDLEEWEKELTRRHKELTLREGKVEERESAVTQAEAALATREDTVAKREAAAAAAPADTAKEAGRNASNTAKGK